MFSSVKIFYIVSRTVRVFNPERTKKQGLMGYAFLAAGGISAFTIVGAPIAPTLVQQGLSDVIDAFTKPVYA
jgi:hypothetical protein